MHVVPGVNFLFVRLAFILSLAVAVFGCSESPVKQIIVEDDLDYKSYRDIPGVTAEEIDAVERLKEQRDGFVYAMNPSTEAFLNEDGSIGGYSVLFCGWLNGLFGIPFKPETAEWDNLIAGLESFYIDFTGDLTATDERRNTYFMTGTIAERPIKIMRIDGSEPLSVLGKTRSLRYGFLEGTTAHDLVSPYLSEDYFAMFFGDYDTVYQALKNDAIDAFFEDGPAEAAFDVYGDVRADDFYPLIYGPVSLTTQNPELGVIISVVQKALDAGVVHHLTRLYNQGYRDYLRRRLTIQLTEAEKEYIRLHRSSGTAVKIAAEYDNYPASFYNSHEKEW
jgi:ABC-type amino acid transport substrate-binding protein